MRATLAILVAALACSAVGNGIWSYLGDPSAYRIGGLADVFYFANIPLFIVALTAGQRARPSADAGEAPPGRRQVMQGADLVGREQRIRCWQPAADSALAELNSGFRMRDQDGHYFTMWYGVYQRSTGMLHHANAGHPPPLLLARPGGAVALPHGDGTPLGMLADGGFTAQSCSIGAGSELLLYSDGILGEPPRVTDLIARCTDLAAASPDWLDSLVDVLPVSPDGQYEDDCSLVRLDFSGSPGR